MGQKPLTPEEKLFAVIQRGGQGASTRRLNLPSLSLKFLWPRLKEAIAHPRLNLVVANRTLFGLIGVLVVAGVLNPLAFRPDVDMVMAKAIQQVQPVTIAPPLTGLKPLETYQRAFVEHNPFRLSQPAPVEMAQQLPPPAGPSVEELVKDFRLVGIAWGEKPIAMIEQVSQQHTYFVKAGESLAPFTVKAVLRDHILLTLDQREIELR